METRPAWALFFTLSGYVLGSLIIHERPKTVSLPIFQQNVFNIVNFLVPGLKVAKLAFWGYFPLNGHISTIFEEKYHDFDVSCLTTEKSWRSETWSRGSPQRVVLENMARKAGWSLWNCWRQHKIRIFTKFSAFALRGKYPQKSQKLYVWAFFRKR